MASPGSASPAALDPPSSVPSPASAVAAFINKVWSILGNEDYKHLISWSECGKNVIVRDYPNFSKEVLPRYFKHNNFNSFVRQLNLYGFRKVAHPEQGVLSKVQVSEPVEFWHPNFRRGHPELLYLVQRRPVASRITPAEEKSSELSKVLTDIHQMKGKQENMGDLLESMRQDNVHLRKEIEVLRQKHTRQQRVLNKIIQFLVHMVYKGKLPSSGRRRHESSKYLMLTDSEGLAPPAKRGRVALDTSPLPFAFPESPLLLPDYPKLQIEAAAPEVNPIDSVPSVPFPTVTSPPPSPHIAVENTLSTQYTIDPAMSSLLPSLVDSNTSPLPPPPSAAFTATTNALATITSSPPLTSTSSLLPTLPSSTIGTRDSSEADISSSTLYPNWTALAGHLDTHQQELDSLPDFLSNQLSVDPTILNQFISFGDTTVPDYDAIDTARLLEALSEEDEGDVAILKERSPQTALIPAARSEATLSLPPGVVPSHTAQTLSEEEDEQSSSLRELLELSEDTDS